jgi:hypothetical protein
MGPTKHSLGFGGMVMLPLIHQALEENIISSLYVTINQVSRLRELPFNSLISIPVIPLCLLKYHSIFVIPWSNKSRFFRKDFKNGSI